MITFDSKKFREDHPNLYDEYIKMSDVKSSIRIKVKENADAVAVICGVNGASANFACACGSDAVAKGAHAGNILKQVSAITGGGGGGDTNQKGSLDPTVEKYAGMKRRF